MASGAMRTVPRGLSDAWADGIDEGELHLAQGDPVAVVEGAGGHLGAVQEHPVAALQVLDLVAGSAQPDHRVVAGDAGIRQAQGIIQFPPDIHLDVDQFEFARSITLLNEQLGHGVPFLRAGCKVKFNGLLPAMQIPGQEASS